MKLKDKWHVQSVLTNCLEVQILIQDLRLNKSKTKLLLEEVYLGLHSFRRCVLVVFNDLDLRLNGRKCNLYSRFLRTLNQKTMETSAGVQLW